MEDAEVTGGLMAVQFIYAGNSVLLRYLMSLGLNPFTVVIVIASATFLFLCPLLRLYIFFSQMNLMNDVHTEEHLAQEIEFHVAASACSDLLSQRNSDWHKLEVQRMGTKKRGPVLVSIFRPLEWNSFLRHSLCLHLREHYYFHLKIMTWFSCKMVMVWCT
ncbi:uncharacterized protein LOC111808626 isoform X1 [Cucurbita pepo subsp. pepo]|uniref:uncharacterized protein LOC111808626 isoform X1 n=1 Tax=Cucurbita pepo subsp. pepo TaxID=3664 RepID=UPI000C9D563A|nr:uncharacterized protein LOC111808626 isoform X1 [Cucurbita pepo subsp. pepo]